MGRLCVQRKTIYCKDVNVFFIYKFDAFQTNNTFEGIKTDPKMHMEI